MVDIPIVNGINQQTSLGGHHLVWVIKAASVVRRAFNVAGYEVRISALLSENQWPLAALLLEEARHAGTWRRGGGDNLDLAGHLVHGHAKMSHL
jgi:hypothetical protein